MADPAAVAQGEQTRARIIVAIKAGCRQQYEIATAVGITQGKVSLHMARLKAAGRVTVTRAHPRAAIVYGLPS